MAKEPRCSICVNPSTRVAVAERRAKGDSFQQIASHLGLSKASVHRHAQHAKLPGRSAAASGDRKTSQPRRRAGGRCQACGTLRDDPSPQAIVKRAESVLAFGEEIMRRAIDDEDFRLALQAIDRARQSLDQLLKVLGLMRPDGVTVNVAIDARRSLEVWFGGLSEDAIRRLTHLLSTGVDLPALVNKIAIGPAPSTLPITKD